MCGGKRKGIRTLSEPTGAFLAGGAAAAGLAGAAAAAGAEVAPATVTPSALPGKLRRRGRGVSGRDVDCLNERRQATIWMKR